MDGSVATENTAPTFRIDGQELGWVRETTENR